jgi:dipicolinate synthase subunit B
MTKIGFAITSSFCSIGKILDPIQQLIDQGYEIIPIVSPAVIETNTRFGDGKKFKEIIEKITNNKIVSTIVDAERFGPAEPLDVLVVAPATGNFIAKFANGITDNTVSMAVKATMRNNKPIVIGVSTNDGLGLNGENIMKLLNNKNIYFVPFGQDDHINKPNSLVAHFDLLLPTIEEAINNHQYQPVIKEYKKTK